MPAGLSGNALKMNEKKVRVIACPACFKKVNPRKNDFCPSCGYEIFIPIMDRNFNLKVMAVVFILILAAYFVFRLFAFNLYVYLDLV